MFAKILIGVLLIVCLAGMTFGLSVVWPDVSYENLRVRQIEIVDDAGQVRIVLACQAHTPSIEMFDQSGKPCLHLVGSWDGRQGQGIVQTFRDGIAADGLPTPAGWARLESR